MQLTLCLPGLLLPGQAFRDTASDLALPALCRLLGHGRVGGGGPLDLGAWAARRWNLPALPAAALRVLAAGGDPGDDAWLCLDPVHLEVHRRGVRLADPHELGLDAAEDQALRADLAPLFAGVGELDARAPGRWELRLAAAAELETHSPTLAAGRDVDPTLPGGRDGPRWRSLLAEAQSLLHGHAVNRRRDAEGRPRINSLWPWGHGALPRNLAAPFDAIWSADPLLQGLARAGGAAAAPSPTVFAAAPGRILAVLDGLSSPALGLDAHAWRKALAHIENEWFAPTLAALRRGDCRSLTLVGLGPEASVEVAVARRDLWKFWRSPRPLVELAP